MSIGSIVEGPDRSPVLTSECCRRYVAKWGKNTARGDKGDYSSAALRPFLPSFLSSSEPHVV
jgi:hypothetical protein